MKSEISLIALIVGTVFWFGLILTSGWWGQWIPDPAWRTCIVAGNCGVTLFQ